MNSKPLHTMPISSKAKMAVRRPLSWPLALESLLGMLRAEKSIVVWPIWRVEGVWGRFERGD